MARPFLQFLPTSLLNDDPVGDHIFGLIPLLASMMNGAGGTTEGTEDPRSEVDRTTPVRILFDPWRFAQI